MRGGGRGAVRNGVHPLISGASVIREYVEQYGREWVPHHGCGGSNCKVYFCPSYGFFGRVRCGLPAGMVLF